MRQKQEVTHKSKRDLREASRPVIHVYLQPTCQPRWQHEPLHAQLHAKVDDVDALSRRGPTWFGSTASKRAGIRLVAGTGATVGEGGVRIDWSVRSHSGVEDCGSS